MSEDFIRFAAAHGVILENPIPDNRRHRAATVHRPNKKNAWYRWDGRTGWVLAFDGSGEIELYRPDGVSKTLDSAKAAEIRRQAEADQAERERAYKAAAAYAQEVVKRCTYAPHPYFIKKSLEGAMGLVDPVGVRWRRNEAPRKDCLVIPMRHHKTGDLQSVQWIDADGHKLFLPEGRAGGAAFAIGPKFAQVTWLCEGYATGLSIEAALKELYRTQDRILVCFSAHNLKRIAEEQRGTLLIVADNDKPDSRGRRAGQEAAEATKRPWVMPPEEGTDANDYMAAKGARALAELLRELLM